MLGDHDLHHESGECLRQIRRDLRRSTEIILELDRATGDVKSVYISHRKPTYLEGLHVRSVATPQSSRFAAERFPFAVWSKTAECKSIKPSLKNLLLVGAREDKSCFLLFRRRCCTFV